MDANTQRQPQEAKAVDSKVSPEGLELRRKKAELSSRILALKAESAKIASELQAAGIDYVACW
jgi:uncharacterized small protein (DUF1192 family)